MTRSKVETLDCFTNLVFTRRHFVFEKGMVVRYIETVRYSDAVIKVETGGRFIVVPLDAVEVLEDSLVTGGVD